MLHYQEFNLIFLIIVQQDFSIMVCDWNKPLFEYSGYPNIGLLNNRYTQQTFAIRYLNGPTTFLVQINFCHSNSGLVRYSDPCLNFDSKGWSHKLVPLMFNFFQRIFVINLFSNAIISNKSRGLFPTREHNNK